jgi:apolipoprotein N-acyltransferase
MSGQFDVAYLLSILCIQAGFKRGVWPAGLIFGAANLVAWLVLQIALGMPMAAIVLVESYLASEIVFALLATTLIERYSNQTKRAERLLKELQTANLELKVAHQKETALRSGAQIVAWQESSAWVLEEDKPAVLGQAVALAKRYNAYLQISLEVFTHAPGLPYLRDQSILIDPSGQILWTYDKTHPVPYDEAFVTISGPGKLPLVDTPYGRWSTAICYDTYFPALIRQAGKNNTDILFAPTNDVHPYAASAIAMADYRAIENGFVMIRPTGNGLSAVIDPLGRVLASQDYSANSNGIMRVSIPTPGVTTLYSRVGDAFAYLCVIGLILLMGQALLRRQQPVAVSQRQPA